VLGLRRGEDIGDILPADEKITKERQIGICIGHSVWRYDISPIARKCAAKFAAFRAFDANAELRDDPLEIAQRAFHIPLASADALEIDRWAETPVTFTKTRWLKPIERFRDDGQVKKYDWDIEPRRCRPSDHSRLARHRHPGPRRARL
jgi:hypothetical protein